MGKYDYRLFENIARRVHLFSDEEVRLKNVSHPFEERNIHSKLPNIVTKLFVFVAID